MSINFEGRIYVYIHFFFQRLRLSTLDIHQPPAVQSSGPARDASSCSLNAPKSSNLIKTARWSRVGILKSLNSTTINMQHVTFRLGSGVSAWAITPGSTANWPAALFCSIMFNSEPYHLCLETAKIKGSAYGFDPACVTAGFL